MRMTRTIVLLLMAMFACVMVFAPATASAQSTDAQEWSDTAVVSLVPSEEPNLTTPIPEGQNPQGVAILQFNDSSDQVCYQLWVSGVNNVTTAHIHQGEPGVNGPVVAWLFPDEPSEQQNASNNVTTMPGNFSGMLAMGNITDADLTGPMEGKTVKDLVDAMKGGQLYVNVHTTQNPTGEVRGQIDESNIWTNSMAVPMTPLEEPRLNYTDSRWNLSEVRSMLSQRAFEALEGRDLGETPWGVGIVQPNGSNVHYAIWAFSITNVTQAHFHMGPRGEEGPPVAWLYPASDATAPANVTPEEVGVLQYGKMIEGNTSDADLVGPMEGMAVSDLLTAMGNGSIYINVHTTQNPNGEIRGQIDPVNMSCGMKMQPASTQPSPSNQSPSAY